MALKEVIFQSKTYVPVTPCQTVYLCLTDAWETQTVNGTKFVQATLKSPCRYLDGTITNPLVPYKSSSRGEEKIQYHLQYNDDDLLTGNKTIPCNEIEAILPEACLVEEIVELKVGEVSGVNTTTGAYTALEGDFGKHVRVDNNIALFDAVAADIGKKVSVFNTSGGGITVSVDGGGTLNGSATLATVTGAIFVVVAAGTYDRIG